MSGRNLNKKSPGHQTNQHWISSHCLKSAELKGRGFLKKGFLKKEAVHLRSTSKRKGGSGGGPTLGPMLKSLHRGLKGGGADPLDLPMKGVPFGRLDCSPKAHTPVTQRSQWQITREAQRGFR